MNQETTLQFVYEGSRIDFLQTPESVMVNATEMAKAFGKRVDVFLKSEHAKAFIEVLEFTPYGGNSEPLKKSQILKTKGQSGTWMHRLLALKFAAWLSPEFEVWVYATIEKILFGHFEELQKNFTEATTLKKRRLRLQEELYENPIYLELEEIKLKERQLAYRRGKFNRNQLDLPFTTQS